MIIDARDKFLNRAVEAEAKRDKVSEGNIGYFDATTSRTIKLKAFPIRNKKRPTPVKE